MLGSGDVLTAEDKLADARAKYEQSLELRLALGEKANGALTRARLAMLSLEQNRPPDAESLALQAKRDLENAKAPEMAAATEAVLARALLAEGKLPDAQAAVDRALALSDSSPDRTTRFGVALAAARVEAASGKLASAQQRLTRALEETRKFGYALYESECRLTLAEIALRSHSANSGARSELKLLASQARQKAFPSSPAKQPQREANPSAPAADLADLALSPQAVVLTAARTTQRPKIWECDSPAISADTMRMVPFSST